ncbi:MAG: hypothetical protein ACJ8F3_04800 [Xanthobacteraceae bacterium]
MQRQSGFLFGFCGVAFATASFIIGLEVSATTATPAMDANIAAINRTMKGDRLPLTPPTSRNAVNAPAESKAPARVAPQLLPGCEAVVSAIGQPPLSRVAGRCVS